MENKALSQKEYLKKYLSPLDSSERKKKKKKKPKVGARTVKIIDDDIDLDKIRPIEDNEFDILLNTEDAPQIVGIIDERGPVDFSEKRRWKVIADDYEGDISFKSSGGSNKKIFKNTIIGPVEVKKESVKKQKRQKRNDDSDNDLSPPRPARTPERSIKNNRNPSPLRRSKKQKKRNDSDFDLSPPRENKNNYDSDESPPRKRKTKVLDSSPPTLRNNSDSDLSPMRKRQKSDSDASPPRRNKELSPSRKHKESRSSFSRYRKHEDSQGNSSKDRKNRYYEKNAKKHVEYIDSYNKKDYKNRYNQDGNERDRRYRKNWDAESSRNNNQSHQTEETRRRKNDERRNEHKNYNKDNERHKNERDCRQESRSESHRERRKPSRWNNDEEAEQPEPTDTRMKKTLDGKTAGLQDAKALREETIAFKKKEAEEFKKMSKDISGAGQATVVRDRKTGRKRDLESEAAEKREKQKRQDEVDEKYSKWGKGLKQVQDREDKLQDDLYEMSKPLARYADDADLDRRQREQEREGDPMLEYIKQKQIKEGKRRPDAPKYEGSFMPNRYGIKPGHRWDGVDRSNGYEKKWFDAQNAKVAAQEEAYKWSTADM
ncbi:BUD13 homolog [Prorops nasuta]|uniref:BUD13 homolog n=1 Tax=Prorops nasuta TaxID=863751 RepID=UPI0034CEA177